MSDIDDLLSEFDAPAGKQGYDRYIPDPAEALATYRNMAQGGWESIKQGATQLGQFGGDPLSRIKGVGNIGLGLAQQAGAIPAGIGKYFGGPIGRGIEDVTGSPTAGQIAGSTVELAPALMVPFPGANALRAGPEAASMVAGELPAARMATEGLITKFGARGAPAASTVDDDFDSLVDEIAPATRKTTAAKDVDYRIAEDWYKKVLTDYEPQSTLPPMSPPVPKDVRFLHKGSPKVGERKYARDEAGEQVNMQGYQDYGGVPTFRTSHSPRMPQEAPAPTQSYEDVFSREIQGQPQFSQMPLHPGSNPQALQDMWLPNVRDQASVDPRLLAELKLKFGGGSPQGQLDNPPWMPQPSGGQRPPAQMPIPGARPMQPQQTNVQFPNEMMPVPMGTEARQNTNRLRSDLGLPLDESEIARQTRAPLNERPPIPEKPITPAEAPKAVTQYGEIEVGQPYDIVMNMGGQEMRSAGGTVKELTYKNEPVVKSGKSVMEPVGYAILEDGRQVPVKLLQRSGTAQPNIQMSAPTTEAMPKPAAPTKTAPPPVASSAETVDPAFTAVQKKMADTQKPKDLTEVTKGIKRAFKYHTGKTTYTQMMQYMPEGTSRNQIDKALKEIKKTKPNLITATDPKTKEKYAVMGKLTDYEKSIMSAEAKDANFNMGIKAIREKIKGTTTYLHNFSANEMNKVGADIKPAVLTKKLNDLLASGKIKVVGENTGKEYTNITSKMITSPEDFDEDLLISFTEKKAKK